MVLKDGLLLKEFPEESYKLRNIENCTEFLEIGDGQERYVIQLLILCFNSAFEDLKIIFGNGCVQYKN